MLSNWTKADHRKDALHASERILMATGYPTVDEVLRGAEKIAAFINYEPMVASDAAARSLVVPLKVKVGRIKLGRAGKTPTARKPK